MNRYSCWDIEGMPIFSVLKNNAEADVCVVGGGIAGLSAAYALAVKGKSVIVLEKNGVGSGQTGLTTAHISNVLDWRYFELEKLFGNSRTRMLGKSHTEAIKLIEEIVTKEKIDCDFEKVDGYLCADSESEHEILNREYETLKKLGVMPVNKVERAPLENFDTGPCLQFPDQAQFQPLKYLGGLATVLKARGVKIYTQTNVSSFEEDKTGVTVKTENGCIVRSRNAVMATNAPTIGHSALQSKQVEVITYVIGIRTPKNSVKKALYWDTMTPYHYARVYRHDALDHDLLIVGGEDKVAGREKETEDDYEKILNWTKKRFPVADKIDFGWSGRILEPRDKVAYIGLYPGNKKIYIITGEAGSGMTYGTMGGMLVTDLITEKENPLAALYEPSREPV